MKVLFVSSINKYGAAQSFLSLCKYLVLEGIDVSAVISKKGNMQQELQQFGIKNYYIPFGHSTYNPSSSMIKKRLLFIMKQVLNLLADIRIWILIKKNRYDIVHINSTVIDVGSIPAHLCHVKLFRHLREFVEEDFGREFYNKAKSYKKIELSDCIIAISKAIRDKYINYFEEDKISVIYNGIEEEKFTLSSREILQNQEVNIVMVGQLNAGKGQAQLIEALNLIRPHLDIIHVSIVGDGEEMCYLQSLVDSYGLSGNIEFLGYRKDVPQILLQNDICVVASRMEAFGRVTVEGMMAGCLVIGADSAGTAELLEHDKGLLYSVNSAVDLAGKIIYAVNHRLEMQQMAREAKVYALKNYTALKNAQGISRLYCEVLGESLKSEIDTFEV